MLPQGIQQVTPELVAAGVTIIVALIGVVQHYRRTGTIPLRDLPWRALRRVALSIRTTYFTRGRAPTTAVIDAPYRSIEERLARIGGEPAWPLSFHYHGEDSNIRFYYYDDSEKYPHRQLHIRLFDRGDKTELYAHEESSALHHPKEHISGGTVDATEEVAAAYSNTMGESAANLRSALPFISDV
jgi:hypothetical protein